MWDNAPLLRNIANFLLGCSVLAMVYGAVHYVVHLPSLLPIRTVRLMNAPERVSPAEVLALVKIGVKGNFLTLDINRLRQSLEGLPWVRSVSIRREFPNGLAVQIEEHQAVARWNDDALVNRQGEVFVAQDEQPLPRFIGIDGSSAEVLDEYMAFDRQLAALNLHVSQIALSARHAWQLHLDDGTVVELGREALEERMARFVAYQMTRKAGEDAAPKAGDPLSAGRQGSVVDMRYRNGFAVRVTGKAEG
jgi:cell division protein FtsQ